MKESFEIRIKSIFCFLQDTYIYYEDSAKADSILAQNDSTKRHITHYDSWSYQTESFWQHIFQGQGNDTHHNDKTDNSKLHSPYHFRLLVSTVLFYIFFVIL